MTVWARVREVFTMSVPSRYTFDSPPRPIDQVIADMLGVSAGAVPPRVGRDEALSVPGVLKGRNMICSVSTLPLVQRGPDLQPVTTNPLFRQLDRDVANVVTLAQTVEDLLFESISWWQITGRDFQGFPTDIRHLDVRSVSIDPPQGGRYPAPLPSGIDPHEPVVWVNGRPTSGREVIRFDSPNPPVLKAGARAVKRAVLLDQAARMYAEDPSMLEYFTTADGADPLPDDEIERQLSRWRWMRKRRATGYIPPNLKRNNVESPNPRDLQLVELQKQAAMEIANAIGVDPEDLGISTTSRTYQNDIDRRQARINDVLAPYMRAITDRLSMGDVTPRGHTVAFVLDDYLKADPATRWAVYGQAVEMGAMTVEEVREREGWPPLPPGAAKPAPPIPVSPGMGPVDEPMDVEAMRERVLTFDRGESGLTQVGVPVTGFTVDQARRTIAGTIMPYGETGNKYGLALRFAQGALKWIEASRVKLNIMHDNASAVGYAELLKVHGSKVHARFKIMPGAEGDRVLAMAQHKVLDAFSVGVEFNEFDDSEPDPLDKTGRGLLIKRADLRHVALTPEPVFDNARVTSVAASRTTPQGGAMPEDTEATAEATEAPATTGLTLSQEQARLLLTRPGALETLLRQQTPTPPPDGLTLSAEQIDTLIASGGLRTLMGIPALASPTPPTPGPTRVDPTRRVAATAMAEPAPYVFDRKGNLRRGSHDFSSDLFHAFGWNGQQDQGAYDRALGFVSAQFDVVTSNVAGLNPNLQRPDLYVDQRDFRYPVWDSVNKGTLEVVTPFVFPKFNTASGLVGAHVQGTEPTSGAFTVTTQTVTPTPTSGKAKISREVFDQGGNPQVSDLIWRQMQRGWYEGLEAAIIAELDAATPTSLGAFTVGGGTNKQTLVTELEAALAALQFVRGGFTMTDLFCQVDLYLALVAAKDTSLRPYYASMGQQNARGSTESRFGTLDINGVAGYPTWALAATGIVPASSYLFDRVSVHGWASAPNRLEMNVHEVANVYLGIWGYKATAISDMNGLRELIYDPA